MNSGSVQELLVRMLGKKLFVVLWRPNAGAEIGPVLREHLEYMIELERRGVLFASGPLSGKPGDGLSICAPPRSKMPARLRNAIPSSPKACAASTCASGR